MWILSRRKLSSKFSLQKALLQELLLTEVACVLKRILHMGECSEPSFNILAGEPSLMALSPITMDESQNILAEFAVGDDSSDEEEYNPKDNWLPLDDDLLSEALNGGPDRSKSVNSWARRRFDEWRKDFGLDLSIPIEKLNLVELNRMMTRFMLQAKKKNGKIYPPGTLSSLLRGIGRIVRREQQRVQGETWVHEVPFNILSDPIFSQTREAFVCMVKKLRKDGNYEKPKKKAPVITFVVEKDILDDVDHQMTHPTGCIKRLLYYMLTRFGIRGNKEVYQVKDVDMTLEVNEDGELVKYGERLSKNHNPSVTKYDDHHFRQPIWTYERDFVLTYKQYVRHLPAKENNSEARHFFLQPIPRYKTNVWYAVTPVGINSISKWLNTMASTVHPDTEICNKSGRVSLVSRLSAASIPSDVGMAISGHRTTPCYERYDRTRESKINACMNLISQPANSDGSMRAYKDVLCDEVAKQNIVGAVLRNPLQELNVNSNASSVLRASEHSDVSLKENTGGQITEVADGQISEVASGKIGSDQRAIIELEEDAYDDAFYDELRKAFPDSAKAIDKFSGPIINTSGSFINCTFNFGIDINQLAGVISSALSKNRP